MGFSEAISTCYSKFFVFEGRASRSEFWYFRLFVGLANGVITILEKLVPKSGTGLDPMVIIMISVSAFLLLMPDISVQVRRFHDRGISGFWLLPIVLIPGIMIVALYSGVNGGSSSASAVNEALPLLGLLWLGFFFFTLVVSVLPGQKGANKYGADPLECNDVTVLVRTPPPITNPGQNDRLDSLLESHFPRSRDALPQDDVESSAGKQNSVPSLIQGADEASGILLKYNDEARMAYGRLMEYPVDWQNEYKQRLVANPVQDPEALVGIVVLKFLGRSDLAWSNDIWGALESTRKNNKASLDEFIRVFSLLINTMTPGLIADKVIFNSRGAVWRTYLIADHKGTQHKIYRYVSECFSIEGYPETFHDIVAVYDRLDTPRSMRVALYSNIVC